MAEMIKYGERIIVFDEISEQTWAAKYVGRHPTIPGWHIISSSGAEREVNPDGYIFGPIATLRVRNPD